VIPRVRVSRAALLVAVLAIAAALTTLVTGRHLDVLEGRTRAAAAAADAVPVVADAISSKLAAPEVVAPADGPGESADAAVAHGVAASSLTLARDSGKPVLDDASAGVAVVARYGSPTPPTTVQDRRNQVVGYQVIRLDLDATLKKLMPEGGGIAVNGPDRRVRSLPPTGPGSAPSYTASLGPALASGWTVTVWTKPTRTPTAVWLLAALLLMVGLVAAGWIAVRQAEARVRRDELRGLQQTSATVAEIATLAQHSLDLGDVLPAVATELSTVLELRGLSLTAPSPIGERPIFVLGTAPDLSERPQERQEVAPGETLAVVLSRGGRIVSTLRVTAGRRLDREDIHTIMAAGDVLTSALTNAEIFSQQAELITRMRTVDELKTVFLATASHELRTPVVAIAGYANLLHSSWDALEADAARGYAERVDSIAQRLNRLVEDILDFSRLQSGNSPDTGATLLDLAETVGQMLDDQPDLAPEHTVHYLPGQGLSVRGSRQAVERVLTNLVGNAAKYADAGTTIRVITREAGGHAELVVEDEGPGIPADQRDQVFSPFYRGSGDAVVRTRGAGLGLAIVSEFAASMGGLVRVDEAEGGGASFVVSYPIAVSEPVEPGRTHVQA